MNIDLHEVTLSYEDTKTSIEFIMEKLKKGGYPVKGKPEFLKGGII